MPRYELEYPKEPLNTVKRYNARATYALETIHGIVNAAPLVHVSFQPAGSLFPVTLPMIGQMGSFARPSAGLGDVLEVYLHGYVSSRLVNESRTEDRLPVCVAASLVDGVVLALTPNAHDYNYRSAVLFGYAAVVTDAAERLWAMQHITDGVVPQRWAQTRVPPNAAELQSTSILRIRVVSGSAKIRTGGPRDKACDTDDAAVRDRVWAGVLPLHPTLGPPQPAAYNAVAVPPHVAQHVDAFNAAARAQALAAVRETD